MTTGGTNIDMYFKLLYALEKHMKGKACQYTANDLKMNILLYKRLLKTPHLIQDYWL